MSSFEECLARLTRLPLRDVQALVRGAGGKDLAIACKAARIEEPQFVTAFVLARSNEQAGRQADPFELAHAMTAYEETSDRDAVKAVEAWRAEPRSLRRDRWVQG